MGNKAKRSTQAQQAKRAKIQEKLKRRLAQKKAELADPKLREERLAKNIPRTVENTREWLGDKENDARFRPVQFVSQPDNKQGSDGDQEGGQDVTQPKLDMAGLEDLFPSIPTAEASASTETQEQYPQEEDSQLPKILITTCPRPSKANLAFLSELQSLLGGPSVTNIVPRRNARYELSKVTKWAAKRKYTAMIVVGEDNKKNPATLSITNLPVGPSAHFRLTTITRNKELNNHGAPTSHYPELVMSNFATPLGLSVGHILQSLFPPMPDIEGRQVVVVRNQRDWIFFRRYRYMFSVRAGDSTTQKLAKERGMDPHIRARMQEIGPRFTLKLRWIKKGTLEEGRRSDTGMPRDASSKEKFIDEEINPDEEEEAPEMEEDDMDIVNEKDDSKTQDRDNDEDEQDTNADDDDDTLEKGERKQFSAEARRKRRKKNRLTDEKGRIIIPHLIPTQEVRPGFKKRKKPCSILDTIDLQGGMKDSSKEFAWKPSMNKKKKIMFL